MNTRIDSIRAKLAALDPVRLDIIDDSHKHAGHAGARDGGGHFAVHIVSAQFVGKSTAACHRMVYSALGDMMKRDIHALILKTSAPNEH